MFAGVHTFILLLSMLQYRGDLEFATQSDYILTKISEELRSYANKLAENAVSQLAHVDLFAPYMTAFDEATFHIYLSSD